MPKITLLNSETGKTEDFEPVDAREILADHDTIYKVPKKAAETIGKQYDPGTTSGINVPQLQGGDAELQTGLSIEKYGREAVVKAQPGDPVSAGKTVVTTTGRSVEGTDPRDGGQHAKPSDGLKVEEIKEALAKKGVAIPDGVTLKADLAALLDAA